MDKDATQTWFRPQLSEIRIKTTELITNKVIFFADSYTETTDSLLIKHVAGDSFLINQTQIALLTS